MTNKNEPIKYFSMFSGIGGFEFGLQQAEQEFECIGFSEINKYARSIYERHYPDHIGYGDATEIRTEELPDFNLLVGGFPCQAFSIAGKRRGFDDTRGTLFFEIARILKDKRPRYFLLENVKGLLSHGQGQTFQKILEICDELGYYVQWQVYNSKDYGVPQNRERVFIKGYSRTECGCQVLSFRGTSKSPDVPISSTYWGVRAGRVHYPDEHMNTLSATGQNSGGTQIIRLNDPYKNQGSRVYDPNGITPAVNCNGGEHTIEPKLIKLNEGKSQATRVYDSNGLSCSLSANGGGQGAKTGLYKVELLNGTVDGNIATIDANYSKGLSPGDVKKKSRRRTHIIESEIKTTKVKIPVKRRKYTANISELQQLLRKHKKESKLTTPQISQALEQPKTMVEHWFRTDKSFSIPDASIWFDLKTLLGIKDTQFDKFITEFEVVDGEYDMANRVYSADGLAPTLNCSNQGLYEVCKPVMNPDRVNKSQNGRRIKEDDEPMYTLTAQDKHGITDGYRIRKLTPVECERLQGFPDDWTKYGKDDEIISDSQRYKCCGNAVTTTVITAIINQMFNNGGV